MTSNVKKNENPAELTNPYKGYSYKRKHKKTSFFAYIIVTCLIGVIFLFANLFFGFINFSQANNSKTTMPTINTWAVVVDELSMKSNALRLGLEVKNQGGAGFLFTEETSWLVVENTYMSKQEAENNLDIEKMPNSMIREFQCEAKQVFIKNKEHNKVFNTVIDSFKENFELMNDYLNKLRIGAVQSTEVSGKALIQYNNLRAAVKELDEIQVNAQDVLYARVIMAANKQMLSLYLLSGAGGGQSQNSISFEATLANCICNIFFTYFELSNSIIQ